MTSKSRTDSAAAEMIGALALIALFVAAIAIIAVVLFSQTAPDKIPAVSMSISNQSTLVTVAHDGGEALTYEDIIVRVDGMDVPSGDLVCHNCGSDLSVGDTIQIDLAGDPRYSGSNLGLTPNKVDVIYVKGGQEHQLMTTRYLGTMAPTPTPGMTPKTPSPINRPVADFTGTPLTGPAPLTVQFTDTSTNTPTSWTWEFGDGGTSALQNPTYTYAAPGTYTVNLIATNSAGSDSENKPAYVTAISAYTQRVVAGRGSDYTDSTGKIWSADRSFTAGSWGNTGGSSSSTSNPISGTIDDPLYQSERYGNFEYRFTVPNGDYQVTLKFAEIYWDNAGQRRFNVDIEGTRVLSDIDLIALVGKNAPYDRTFTTTVSDDVLNINFQTITNNAKISSIEITSDSSGTPAPVAAFTATPVSGTAPLSVAFTDQSTNLPTAWFWDFGDGGISTLQNPTYIYSTAGTFTVNLTATNAGGSDSENKTSFITVTSPPTLRILENADKPSNLASGGYFEFRVTDVGWPSISHGGTTYSLDGDDVVRMVIGSDTKGQIYVGSGRITTFAFDNVQLSINGVNRGTGTVSSIWVPGYDNLVSTLSLDTPSVSAWTRFEVNGVPIIPSVTNNSRIQIFNLKPHSTGILNLDNRVTSYYDGGADSYLISPATVTPVASFSGTPTSGIRPLTVQFTDMSTNSPTSWLWNFGDGNTTGSTLQNPSHLYTAAGTYSVNLTATNAGGSNSFIRTSYITVNAIPAPVASFTATPTTGITGVVVQFTDTSTNSPTSWLWDFGDGNTTGNTLQNPSHKYTAAGTYTVRLTATNGGGSNMATRTNYITVTIPPPYAAFTGSPVTGNVPLTVSFTDNSNNTPTSWSWNFGDGGTSAVRNPSHQYTTAGTYSVTLTAANAGGSTTATRTNYIVVTAVQPVAEFSGTPRTGVEPLTVTFTDASTNSPTSWLWDFGDGTTSTVQNPVHQYTSDGQYRVRLTATNSAGSDTESKNNYIDVDTFTADFSYTYEDVAIIPPFWYAYSVDFTGTSNGSPVSWNWNFDGGSGSTTIQNPQDVFYLFGGNYDVSLTVTNSVGTTATVTKRVRLT